MIDALESRPARKSLRFVAGFSERLLVRAVKEAGV